MKFIQTWYRVPILLHRLKRDKHTACLFIVLCKTILRVCGNLLIC